MTSPRLDTQEPETAPRTLTIESLRARLARVLDLVAREGAFRYRLIGTAAALLRGVPLVPGDVDFLAGARGDVDTFARALGAYRCLTPPTWMPSAWQYYAAFEVDGLKIEASTVERPSDSPFLETLGRGPWEHFSTIAAGDTRVAVVALELRLATELRRGRKEHADLLIHWMRDQGCDPRLLENALHAQGIDEHTRSSVLSAVIG
ncbi:hypothetical protein [Pararhodospirillum oryzae]|uniref:Nucleotidyltransferase n=1 Tax=Pararhodospirillum oryzae TaxID=478448 RepID=A0A512H892_9PROT|nr:hypothetical protein [Pararhodospirillum oryzae]GEO81676.1 hypothetical protein ROR02_18070 [Pararhodospirillum oryzae]